MATETFGPTDKSNKYDRQLRLWGDHGQAALEHARVCLINASATGTELLKNLILPGVGAFTVVDNRKVTGEDVGCNFFLTKESIGEPLAQAVAEFLGELNEDVIGDFMEESAESLLEKNADFFSAFNIVIATQLCERTLLQLSRHLWQNGVPLIVCRSYGLVGYVRLVVREHTVVESHPDSAIEDLRLDRPFRGLVEFCDALDMSKMTKQEHSHTPWLVLTYKYLQRWREMHSGELPRNYKEKAQLQELIKEGFLHSEDGIQEEEENFHEAIRHVNTAVLETKVPTAISALFEDPACTSLHSESSPFWIMVRALKDFVQNEGNGALPLRGTIPDMTADSERYIQLQTAYQRQASLDAEAVSRRVHTILQELSRPFDIITDADIKNFCRNAAFLHVLRCHSLEAEYASNTLPSHDIESQMETEDCDDICFYILLRAVDKFFEEYNCYPGGDNSNTWELDVPKLKVCVNKLVADWKLTNSVKDDFTVEMCRYGAAELSPVAAFIGGVAAQEAIKIITHQFVPVNNTFIYNAMRQTSMTCCF